MKSRTGAKAAAVLLAAAACVGPAFAADRWGADYFPNVPLITQDGITVHLYDDLLKGKSVAINVIYTSCQDECPLETARLAQVQRLLGERMGKDIFFYSISIDPKRDTPEVLKKYAEKYGVGPGWLFLTGKPEDIKLVTKKLGLSRGSDSANKDGHTASLMVGDVPGGQWMRNSAVDNPQFLAATIGNFLGWRDTKPGKSYAEARPLSVGQGEYLFGSRCSACHTLGQGDKMLAESDPIATALFEKYKDARMPNLRLGSADVNAVLTYLETKSSAPRAPERSAGAH